MNVLGQIALWAAFVYTVACCAVLVIDVALDPNE